MRTPDKQIEKVKTGNAGSTATGTAPVEFIELGLALELLLDSHETFSDAVRTALVPLDGDFLFDLPHGEDADGKGRVAAVRFAFAGQEEPGLAFIFLSDDGTECTVEAAGGQSEHLTNFAASFVEVLEKISQH